MTPKDWAETPLGEFMVLEYGSSLRDVDRTGTGYAVLGSNGQVGQHSRFLVEGPGIVVGRKGSVGAVTWSAHPFWPIDTTYYVRTLRDCDRRWLFWMMQSLGLARLDSSTGVPGLNRNDAYRMVVAKPRLCEQRAIARIIDAADEAITASEALIAKLRQIKAGLLHDLLTRGIDENGQPRDPVAHPEQFRDSELGMIPVEWDVCTLGSTLGRLGGWIQTGPFGTQLHAYEYQKDGVPVVMPQDINEGRIAADVTVRIGAAKAAKLSRHRLREGDVLFARRGDLSKCAAVTRDQTDWLCGTDCLLMRVPGDRNSSIWFSDLFRHDSTQRQVGARAVGSTMPGLNGDVMSSLVIAWPSYEEQAMIAGKVSVITARISAEEREVAKLRALKQGLMHDLLTGRVRVPQTAQAEV